MEERQESMPLPYKIDKKIVPVINTVRVHQQAAAHIWIINARRNA
jgi:hypothetical protein